MERAVSGPRAAALPLDGERSAFESVRKSNSSKKPRLVVNVFVHSQALSLFLVLRPKFCYGSCRSNWYQGLEPGIRTGGQYLGSVSGVGIWDRYLGSVLGVSTWGGW